MKIIEKDGKKYARIKGKLYLIKETKKTKGLSNNELIQWIIRKLMKKNKRKRHGKAKAKEKPITSTTFASGPGMNINWEREALNKKLDEAKKEQEKVKDQIQNEKEKIKRLENGDGDPEKIERLREKTERLTNYMKDLKNEINNLEIARRKLEDDNKKLEREKGIVEKAKVKVQEELETKKREMKGEDDRRAKLVEERIEKIYDAILRRSFSHNGADSLRAIAKEHGITFSKTPSKDALFKHRDTLLNVDVVKRALKKLPYETLMGLSDKTTISDIGLSRDDVIRKARAHPQQEEEEEKKEDRGKNTGLNRTESNTSTVTSVPDEKEASADRVDRLQKRLQKMEDRYMELVNLRHQLDRETEQLEVEYASSNDDEEQGKLAKRIDRLKDSKNYTDKEIEDIEAKMGIVKEEIDDLQAGKGKVHSPIDRSGTLDNLQIDKIMKGHEGYLGAIANNEIPSILSKIKPKSRVSFVLNTDNAGQPGQHWVSVFADGRPGGSNSIEYFDSFAEDPSKEVLKGLRDVFLRLEPDSLLKFKINRIVQQDDKTSNCGWFATKFLIDRYRGKPFREASGYDDSKKGEKEIEKFKKGFGYMSGNGVIDDVVDGVKDGIGTVKETVENIKDKATEFISGVRTSSPVLNRFIERYGSDVITEMTVYRTPVTSMITNALNVISLGKFDKIKKKLNYDQLFHLFLVFKTKSGSFITEKNETVTVYKGGVSGQSKPVALKGELTVSQFFGNVIKSKGEALFPYDPVKANCQVYISDLLSSNSLITADLKSFIMQDVESLFKEIPLARKIAKKVTDWAARFKLLIGQGK